MGKIKEKKKKGYYILSEWEKRQKEKERSEIVY